ncbi:hypothetical protein ONZ51_g2443 [Trametes cubensis]|uniref:Fork-head domain-containing protein n=1 Tax=Trametes cubensis TaxID=1111947 RepID=A0AAD7TZP0_9APHY|nr:hypothetical protein ONZ51_g2443 [Trametes cubensis]
MASPHRPRPSSSRLPSSKPDPVRETLNRLGLTEEQFKAKQAEMMAGLLRNQPFVPKEAPPVPSKRASMAAAFYEYTASTPSNRASSRARSTSVSSSSSSRDPSPAPRTPARKSHNDHATPRPRDQMELIIEQRNRAKQGRKRASSHQREETRPASTPTHAASQTLTLNHPPETPHHYRYYSERVVGEASGSRRTLDQPGGPVTPSTSRGQFKVPLPPSSFPRTPSNHGANSSLPATPRSSPPPVVNLVSSPGPMRPSPLDEEALLPYTLPPGPYSSAKPELSYAAIIGQAILASPKHALALQDIYEYITTVYPYYKRGEPTWMNSIRHALSTMAVFRKVPRERSEGKSLWAIYDSDVPCFAGGGFKKSLCADMNNPRPKKRAADETGGPRSKRKKVEEPADVHQLPVAAPAPVLPPYFPHAAGLNPYHQPYLMAACSHQQVPTDVLFPPLPPSSNYHRVISRMGSNNTDQGESGKVAQVAATSSQAAGSTTRSSSSAVEVAGVKEVSAFPIIERPPSSSSVPELVPSLSASSSPTPSSHLSLPGDSSRDPSPAVTPATPYMDGPIEDPEAPWLHSDAPVVPQPVSVVKDKGKGRAADGDTVKKRPMAAPRTLHRAPSPATLRRWEAIARDSCVTPEKKGGKPSPDRTVTKQNVLQDSSRFVSPPPMTASVEEIMRAMEEHAASRTRLRSASPMSEAEVLTMVMSSGALSDAEEAGERPCTPEPPESSSLPATPPRRFEDLESELSEIFNFSPFKSPQNRFYAKNNQSPALVDDSHNTIPSMYTPRAPYLRPDNVEDLLSSKSGSSSSGLPMGPPRTPKKTPPQRLSSSGRADSPFGTPSRGMRNAFDDDLASFFQSPGGSSLFDSFMPTLAKSPARLGLQSPGFGGQY